LLKVQYRNTFAKDLKRVKKRNMDLNKLKAVMTLLAEEKKLPFQYHDHALIGNYSGHRECHIQPDWLLIYKKQANLLIFERTGSHADLFKK
jgi:mRNA interferase YafQ